jgi:hypothetical protein
MELQDPAIFFSISQNPQIFSTFLLGSIEFEITKPDCRMRRYLSSAS